MKSVPKTADTSGFTDETAANRASMMREILAGAAAGAAGTTALNVATYSDMTLRGRGGSQVPKVMAERLSDVVGLPIPGDGAQADVDTDHDNRASGLGALLGLATGVAVGTLYGAARVLPWKPPFTVAALAAGAAAMAGSDVPMAALKVSDPRSWQPADWMADLVPHLLYGTVTAAVYELTSPRR